MVTQSPTVENTLWWSTGCSIDVLVIESFTRRKFNVNDDATWIWLTRHPATLYFIALSSMAVYYFIFFFFQFHFLFRCYVAVGRRVPMVSRAIFSNGCYSEVNAERPPCIHVLSLSYYVKMLTFLFFFLNKSRCDGMTASFMLCNVLLFFSFIHVMCTRHRFDAWTYALYNSFLAISNWFLKMCAKPKRQTLQERSKGDQNIGSSRNESIWCVTPSQNGWQ